MPQTSNLFLMKNLIFSLICFFAVMTVSFEATAIPNSFDETESFSAFDGYSGDATDFVYKCTDTNVGVPVDVGLGFEIVFIESFVELQKPTISTGEVDERLCFNYNTLNGANDLNINESTTSANDASQDISERFRAQDFNYFIRNSFNNFSYLAATYPKQLCKYTSAISTRHTSLSSHRTNV